MQCTAMVRPARLSPFAVAFLAWFAVWLVADGSVGFSFYRVEIREGAAFDFGRITLLAALALVFVRFVRPGPGRLTSWSYLLLGPALFILAALVWELAIAPLHHDVHKLLTAAFDVTTPALFALGVIAVASEWRALGRIGETG